MANCAETGALNETCSVDVKELPGRRDEPSSFTLPTLFTSSAKIMEPDELESIRKNP